MSGKLWDRKFLKQNLIGLGILILIPVSVVTCEWRNRVQNKAECRHFLNQIRLGDAQSEVHAKFSDGHYWQLKLRPYLSGKAGMQDMVTSQLQFGANNWYIYVFYDESRVVAIKVRTEDNIRDHPPDAPPDLGTCDFPEFDQWVR